MNLLNKLTKKNLILNKKRTTVTIIGIILSVALITALASLIISFNKSLLVFEKMRTGDFHIAFDHVLSNDIDKFKDNRYIEDVYFSKDIGYSKLEGIKNESKPYVFIKAFDFKALDKIFKSNLLEGRLPKTSDEIVISKHLKTNGRLNLNIGDTIKLDIGKRLVDGSSLNQSNPYDSLTEEFKKEYEKEYKIVGIIERPSYSVEPYSAPGYTFITCLDDTSESNYTAYVRYKHKYLKNQHYVTADILGVDRDIYKKAMTGSFSGDTEEEYQEFLNKFNEEMEKARYDVSTVNSYLISLEYQDISDPSMRALYYVAGIVILIIMVTSIYCIKNSFNISITEKTKQYGMLASIGATRKQIKKNVLYEAFILGLIGIPIGIFSGLFASFVLIKISNLLLGETLNIGLIYSVSIGSILLSIILGSVTIYLSAVRSARKASKISPISAIRNSDDIKIKSKKIKSPKLVKKLFGVGGDVSYKNLKRNNKKYRTTVISIVVCVSIFISLYSFMDLAFKTVDINFQKVDYNIAVNFTTEDKKMKDTIVNNAMNIVDVKDYSINTSIAYSLKNPVFSEEFKKIGNTEIESIMEEHGGLDLTLLSLGDYQYKKYLQKLGLNYEDTKDKAIILNNTMVMSDDGKKHEVPIFDYKKGENLTGSIYDYNCEDEDTSKCWLDASIKVAALTDIRPFGQSLSYHFIMIVSDEFISKFTSNFRHYEILLDVENPDKYQDEMEKVLSTEPVSDYSIYNIDKERKTSKSLFTLVAIFLYGFIVVIALIGITNIFNTITTSVELRAREFATLKSVGMTKREFNKMVSLESIFYGSKSLLICIPIGSILSYLIYKALVGGNFEFPYSYPITAVIISILAVLILVTVIMKYSIRKINKQNTIETIRNDNI